MAKQAPPTNAPCGLSFLLFLRLVGPIKRLALIIFCFASISTLNLMGIIYSLKVETQPTISHWWQWASNQTSTYQDLQDYMNDLMEQNCPMRAFDEMRDFQNNPPSNKTLVFRTFHNGMCDRTSTAVGLFYLAHFAGRSFRMEWLCEDLMGMLSPRRSKHSAKKSFRGREHSHIRHSHIRHSHIERSTVAKCTSTSLFLGYDSPYFDLESNETMIFNETDTYSFHILMDYPGADNNEKAENRFQVQNYNEFIPDDSTQFLIGQSTGGQVHSLLENPHYKEWFNKHGFTHENAFACGYNYLFQPTPLAFQGMEPYFNLLRREELFKIGLHIRAYIDEDHAFHGQGKSKYSMSGWVDRFSQCALEIEETWNTDFKRPLWFVISDNNEVRRLFKKQFSSRVLLMDDVRLQHAQFANDHGMLSSIREHWLFGMTDYHIVRDRTSFGKSAAVRGFRKNSVYQVEQYLPKTKCDQFGFRPYEYLEEDWIKF